MDHTKTQRFDATTLARLNERDKAKRGGTAVQAHVSACVRRAQGSAADDEIRLELTFSRQALLTLLEAEVAESAAEEAYLPKQVLPQPQTLEQRRTTMMTPHDLERARIASSEPQPDPESTVSLSHVELLAMGVGAGANLPAELSRRGEDQKTINIKALTFAHLQKRGEEP